MGRRVASPRAYVLWNPCTRSIVGLPNQQLGRKIAVTKCNFNSDPFARALVLPLIWRLGCRWQN